MLYEVMELCNPKPCPSHLRTCTSSTCRSAVRAAPQLSRGTLQHRLTRFASRLARTSPHCKVRRQVQQKDSEYPALKLSSRAGVRKSTHVRLCNSGCSRCHERKGMLTRACKRLVGSYIENRKSGRESWFACLRSADTPQNN